MNNEDKYFRTNSGLTRFKYETIAAVNVSQSN